MSSGRFLPLLALPLLAAGPGSRRPADVEVQRLAWISADDAAVRHVETALAINPRDPQNLIAASIAFHQAAGSVVYSSHDGGRSWRRAVDAHGDTTFPGVDPSLAFDREGRAYFVTGDNEVDLWTSTDGGQHWSTPTVALALPGDRPSVTVDRAENSRFRDRVYISSKSEVTVFGHQASPNSRTVDGAFLSVSTDHGASFRFPRVFVPDPDKEFLHVPSDLLVTPEGHLIVALQMFPPQDLRRPLLTAIATTVTSSDGGRSFSDPTHVAEWHTYGHANEGKSLFGLGAGGLALDTSQGPYKGTLYTTWLDNVGDHYQVLVAASADEGKTWSAPVRVDDNRTPTDATNPGLAVDGQGRLAVVWNDRRGDPTDRCYQVSFATSTDGGATFSASRRVADTYSCPIGRAPVVDSTLTPSPDPEIDPVASGYRFKNAGDTQGVVGLPQGGFQLAWINGNSGELQLWFAVLAPVTGTRPATSHRL
jgi:hypothetical protein